MITDLREILKKIDPIEEARVSDDDVIVLSWNDRAFFKLLLYRKYGKTIQVTTTDSLKTIKLKIL